MLNPRTPPMTTDLKLIAESDELFEDATFYISVVGGLQHVTIIRPEMSFVVNEMLMIENLHPNITFTWGLIWFHECRSTSVATANISWLDYLLHELQVPQFRTPIIYCDNLSGVVMAANPVLHPRTKHFELDLLI
ncbi:hypothetical protein CR513_13247, partial [Mucuna pruriens]